MNFGRRDGVPGSLREAGQRRLGQRVGASVVLAVKPEGASGVCEALAASAALEAVPSVTAINAS